MVDIWAQITKNKKIQGEERTWDGGSALKTEDDEDGGDAAVPSADCRLLWSVKMMTVLGLGWERERERERERD